MTRLPLPSRCLTLLPPWPFAIRYAGKRLENRSAGVAASLRGYRGLKTCLSKLVSGPECPALDIVTEVES